MPVRLTKEQILCIPGMRIQGLSNKEIALRLNSKQSTINYWIKRLRLEGHVIPKQVSPGRPKMILTPQ